MSDVSYHQRRNIEEDLLEGNFLRGLVKKPINDEPNAPKNWKTDYHKNRLRQRAYIRKGIIYIPHQTLGYTWSIYHDSLNYLIEYGFKIQIKFD